MYTVFSKAVKSKWRKLYKINLVLNSSWGYKINPTPKDTYPVRLVVVIKSLEARKYAGDTPGFWGSGVIGVAALFVGGP